MKIITTPVANALEQQRQNLAERLDPRSIVMEILDNVGVRDIQNLEGFSEAINDLGARINRARELGALDQVCAEHGITDSVMAGTR